MPNEPKNEPKLRGQSKRRDAPHPLGQLPPSLAVEIGKHIVHRLAVGQADITGDDFGVIFAKSISGEHRGKPLGIADVTWKSCAWSVKTVQDKSPFTQTSIRTISGRNSPVFSSGIKDPFADIQATGSAVLEVWNARVNESLNEYDDLRIFIMVRNMSMLEFTLIEIEPTRYVPSEFIWTANKRGNFEAVDKQHNEHRFTWQPHGSQFTVIHHVPASAYRFRITRKPGMLSEEQVLRLSRFEESWIEPVTLASVTPLKTN
jgi:hypothetical protein